MKPWSEAVKDGVISGAATSALSTVALAARGQRESGSIYGPTNAVSHWFWGDDAARHNEPAIRYTLVGYGIHHAAATLWATLYERWFGRTAERGEIIPALAGGAAVAALACFVDYKMTPHRLQPGYEMRLSRRSLFLVYGAFGVGLALRGLAVSRRHPAAG